MPSAVAVSSRIRFAYPVAAVAVLAVFTAGCASSRFDRADVTGATNAGGTEAVYGQPMPPALVGTNPVAEGQATTFAPTNQVATTQLSPAGATPNPQQPTVVAATTATAQNITITAQPGDTLYSLSRTYGVSVAAIAAANGLTQTSTLNIGQRLVIPAPGTTAALGTPPAPLGVITETQPGPVATTTTAQPATNGGVHIVQTGETLYAISLRYGVSVNSLASANGLVSNDIVRVGQQLTIPGGAEAGQQQIAATPAVQTEPAAPTPP
ncbi:MAG: LysM peptidoglycan-binding domain-containing protein, partial [Alphaproteobacteria bacterium]